MEILVINPGSTSTKIAIYDNEKEKWSNNIKHSHDKLSEYNNVIDQLEWRQKVIEENLKSSGFDINNITAIVARGGAGLDPISGGTYKIDQDMVKDLYNNKNAEHASNLAGIIAYNLSQELDIPCYTVDPISIDEFEPVARLSGIPEIKRKCQSHALNLKAISRKTANELNKNYEDINLIGVHLGGGISIAAIKKGKIIDVNNANQNGPYSPERCGTLPVLDFLEYIYEHNFKKEEVKKRLVGKGGLIAYLGTNDGVQIEKRIDNGDKNAELIYNGMIYQIAKEIGSMAAVLDGNVDAIFITGGLANSDYIIEKLIKKINFISDIYVYPGADELENLALGAYRVLNGKASPKIYSEEIINMGDKYDK